MNSSNSQSNHYYQGGVVLQTNTDAHRAFAELEAEDGEWSGAVRMAGPLSAQMVFDRDVLLISAPEGWSAGARPVSIDSTDPTTLYIVGFGSVPWR